MMRREEGGEGGGEGVVVATRETVKIRWTDGMPAQARAVSSSSTLSSWMVLREAKGRGRGWRRGAAGRLGETSTATGFCRWEAGTKGWR